MVMTIDESTTTRPHEAGTAKRSRLIELSLVLLKTAVPSNPLLLSLFISVRLWLTFQQHSQKSLLHISTLHFSNCSSSAPNFSDSNVKLFANSRCFLPVPLSSSPRLSTLELPSAVLILYHVLLRSSCVRNKPIGSTAPRVSLSQVSLPAPLAILRTSFRRHPVRVCLSRSSQRLIAPALH